MTIPILGWNYYETDKIGLFQCNDGQVGRYLAINTLEKLEKKMMTNSVPGSVKASISLFGIGKAIFQFKVSLPEGLFV